MVVTHLPANDWNRLATRTPISATIDRDVPYLDDLGLDRITTVREVNAYRPFIR
jgi:hypothetical protein